MFKIFNNRFLELNRMYKLEQFEENLTTRGTLIMQGKDIHSKNYVRNEVKAGIAIHLYDYYKEDYDAYTPFRFNFKSGLQDFESTYKQYVENDFLTIMHTDTNKTQLINYRLIVKIVYYI